MIPLKLTLENFVSHIHSELDFSKFDAALLIGVHSGNPYISNGVGKTTIFSAMRWCISGKSRFSTKDKVVKRGKSFCRVSLEFEMDGNKYKIVRRLNKKTGIIDVKFYKKIGRKWEDGGLTCDTARLTNRKIVEIIKMSDDTFTNSVYFKQNDVSGFASAPTAKRKEILKEILQIGIWDDYQKSAKDSLKYFEEQQDILNKRLKVIGNTDNKENINEIKKLDKEIRKYENKINILNNKLQEQKRHIVDLEISKIDIDVEKLKEEKKNIIARAKEIKQKKEELKTQIIRNNEIISNSSSDCKGLEERLIKLSKKVLLVSKVKKAKEIFNSFNMEIPDCKYSPEKLEEKKQEYIKHRDVINSFSKDLNDLELIEPGEECPVCFSTIEDINDLINRRDEKKKYLKKMIKNEGKILKELSEEIKKEEKIINASKEALVELERTELMIAKRMGAASEANHKNEVIQIELKNLIQIEKKLKIEFDRIKGIIENIGNSSNKEFEKIIKDRENTIEEIQKIKDNIMELKIQRGIIENSIKEMERLDNEKSVINNQLKIVLREIEIYSNLSKAFGKDGIQAIIMENIAEDLSKYANSILKQICSDPMSIDFITQRQTGSGNWKEQFDIKVMVGANELDFEDLSGGEQVRISIALRLALSQLLMRRVGSNVKFLLLDEVDQALDKQGTDALADTILTLSKSLKILVITHNETMKEKFDNIITIQKGNQGSVINQ